MSKLAIEQFTPEQEALIPIYKDNWWQIATSTKRLDRQKATKVVKALYNLSGNSVKEIIFFDSPFAAFNSIEVLIQIEHFLKLNNNSINKNLCEIGTIFNKLWLRLQKLSYESPVYQQLIEQVNWQIRTELTGRMENELSRRIDHKLWQRLAGKPRVGGQSRLQNICIQPERLAGFCNYFDWDFSVIKGVADRQEWEIFQSLVKECGWIIPLENACIICERPHILSFDNQQQLHGEGYPAIQFTDGFSIYAYHGVTLSEKYGQVPPSQWCSEWLLSEPSAEIRRVLLQGISYNRIWQNLTAIEIDSWQEYTLVKVNNDGEVEPTYLLKMTSPSSGSIHVIRVPPNILSAREAIRWVH